MVTDANKITGENPTKAIEMFSKLQRAFTPHQPISLPDFLAGRLELIHRMTDAINTDGQHVMVYGDRGTGKTSIVRVVAYLVQELDKKQGRRCILVSCTANDSYASIWRKIGQEIVGTGFRGGVGYRQGDQGAFQLAGPPGHAIALDARPIFICKV